MLLGIHILACNEEEVLGRCLSSVQGLADEMVVTDTGSIDRTVDIAAAFGARVVRAAWEDDFAAARNAGLEASRTIWVLALDADEWLDTGMDRSGLRSLLRGAAGDAFSVNIANRYGRQEGEIMRHDAVRLFRTDCGLRYAGLIHEQLVRPGEVQHAVDGPSSGLLLQHDGYLPEIMTRKAKAERNLRLIGKALQQEPDHPFHLYNKGVTLCQLNKPKDAAAAFALASLFAPADAPYRAMLLRDRAKALLALGDADAASALLYREVDRYADHPDIQLVYGDSLMAQRRVLDARGAYEAALAAGEAARGTVSEAGAGTYRARCGLAAAEAALGRGEHALRLYAAAASEAPRYSPALAGWAEQLQAAGERDEAIAAALASCLGEAAPGDAALLARVLGGIGGHAAALPFWREAGPLAPEDTRAYAACLAGAGDAGAARALLLAALGAREETEPAIAPMELQRETAVGYCVDAALYGWDSGQPMGGALRERLAAENKELLQLFAAVERYAAPFAALRAVRTEGMNTTLPGWVSFLEFLSQRSLELGLIRLAGRLSQAAPALEDRHAALLYAHGYAQAAAGRLLRAMEKRPLRAEESFAFGELLMLKGLYSEALGMFEEAAAEEEIRTRAQLGAAFCSLAVAREALLPWAGSATASYGGGWPLADLEQLQLAMMQTEATGWRTPWTAAQRRRMNVGE
ncbi:glycosyltransferase family 2 protein [Paenibacillus sacheonensis]|uniref:Glycosyltransferase n=1 Tax=Paenibacillus sacheonensis TaxID=742054 RepID=A0A7X4YY21_9BACL|nr:glycosyltransferase family 2 protein [Paenibacillus sacheonensis]MBM7566611.1 tetratricopeptide (TPR) repeat protein [Paenibacillus sacheonensis]NBC73529.1 glycosyltransferase [Paenibacillus sacheonensis]